MTWFVYLLLVVIDPPTAQQVDRFRDTAPQYLTTDSAREHLLAARAAGAVYREHPAMLLSIAFHESRYDAKQRTPEPGNRVSCGVMTPVPQRRCSATELTIIGGYDAGAKHLALWRAYYPKHTLMAYAGGGGLVRACAHGSWRTPRGSDACRVVAEFEQRAAMIAQVLL